MKNHALRRGSVSDNVNFIDGGVNPAWPERHRINVIKLRDAGEDQYCLQTRLETGQNIGAQVVADNNGFFRVGLHFVQRGANDPRAGLADIERLAPG